MILVSRESKIYFVKPGTPIGQNRGTNEGALANFFNSLITKKSGGATTPTSAGTPIAQRQGKLFIYLFPFFFSFLTTDSYMILEKKRGIKLLSILQ